MYRLGSLLLVGALAGCGPHPVSNPDGGGGSALLVGDAASHDFGSIVLGVPAIEQVVSVINVGLQSSGELTVAFTGSTTQFSISGDTCTNQALQPGFSCTIAVGYTPTQIGPAVADLAITGSPGGTVHVQVSGNGITGGAIGIAPDSQDFGSVAVGSTSAATTFVVTNRAGSPTSKLTSAITGGDAGEFTQLGDDCTGALLGPQVSCSVTLQFAPHSSGAKKAVLSVHGTGAELISADLAGDGLTPGALTISPTTQAFGDVFVGQTSSALTFTVTNTGTVASGPIASSLTGSSRGEFTLSSDGCNNTVLGAGASCTLQVQLAPTSPGMKTASVAVTATPGGGAASSLTGNATQPANLVISPSFQDLGSAVVGGAPVDFTLMVLNTGGSTSGPLTLTIGGPTPDPFTLVNDTCSGAALAVGASCPVEVSFSPKFPGAFQALLTVSAPGATLVAAQLNGTGLSGTGLSISPTMHDFGMQNVGSASQLVPFTITNNTGASLSGPFSQITGQGSTQFFVANDGCNGQTVPNGGTCIVTVEFAPSLQGPQQATLLVNGPTSASASLTGTGTAAQNLAITPTLQDFGALAVGKSSVSKAFSVSVVSPMTSGVLSTMITGSNRGDFVIDSDGCINNQLFSGTSCVIQVHFSPTATGARAADLRVSASPGGIADAQLSGSGLAGASLTITPTVQSFGTIASGTTSAPFSFTVTDSGGVTSGPLSTAVSGANAAVFTVATDGCAGTTLAAGTSCTVQLTFKPAAAASYSASLSVTGAPGGTASASLSGSGS
jgi:hypothetical protein